MYFIFLQNTNDYTIQHIQKLKVKDRLVGTRGIKLKVIFFIQEAFYYDFSIINFQKHMYKKYF